MLQYLSIQYMKKLLAILTILITGGLGVALISSIQDARRIRIAYKLKNCCISYFYQYYFNNDNGFPTAE